MDHRRRQQPCALIEALETRRLLSSANLRIVAWNIEDDIDGYTTPRPGLATVLEGIGAEDVGGTTKPIDVLALEETTSNSATIAPIVTSLNSFYGANTYATSTYQGTETGGDAGDGNGPSALIYNTKTVKLLASVGVGTPEGSTNGEYRQVIRYELQPVGGTAASDFYIYVCHSKSGSTSTDATDRGEEAQIIRTDEATLPADARVLYVGDFNASETSETYYQTLTGAGQGQAFDPENPTNSDSGTNPAADLLTESATDLQYRDDYQFMTSSVLNDVSGGLEYVSGTYHGFGNNGSVAQGGTITSSTALSGLSNAAAVLSALTTASDHLPIVADYTDPIASTVTTPRSLVAWDMAGQTKSGTQSLAPNQIDSSVTEAINLSRGAGVKTTSGAPANAWGGTHWASTAAAGSAAKESIEFGLKVAAGDTVSLSSISLNYLRTAGGPTSALWQYQLNNGTWTSIAHVVDAFSSTSKHGSVTSLALTAVTALQNLTSGTLVNIRMIPYGATSSSAGFYIYNEKGSDLELNGIVA
jgi:endonuclease/exonuclease/phosphatase family metal-dependent hydrolase